MTEFKGYLMKAGNSNTIFPHKYINISTYKATPNQREEIEAYRDDYTRDLHRLTADGMKSKITFSTVENITLEEKIEIQDFFNSCMVDKKERKVYLTYWDDEDNIYETSYFYYPDIQYTINKLDRENNTIIYATLDYSLTEY